MRLVLKSPQPEVEGIKSSTRFFLDRSDESSTDYNCTLWMIDLPRYTVEQLF